MTWLNRVWLWTYERRWCLVALVVLAVVAFLAGRWTTQERVRVEERERVVERVEYKDRVVEKQVVGPVRIRTVTREIPPSPGSPCPDRPLVVTERLEERGPVVVDRDTESTGDIIHDVVTERVEVPAPLPTWRAGALVGVDLGALSLASPAGALVVGAHVERRVWGPLSVGSVVFVRPSNPIAPIPGLSLSWEW